MRHERHGSHAWMVWRHLSLLLLLLLQLLCAMGLVHWRRGFGRTFRRTSAVDRAQHARTHASELDGCTRHVRFVSHAAPRRRLVSSCCSSHPVPRPRRRLHPPFHPSSAPACAFSGHGRVQAHLPHAERRPLRACTLVFVLLFARRRVPHVLRSSTRSVSLRLNVPIRRLCRDRKDRVRRRGEGGGVTAIPAGGEAREDTVVWRQPGGASHMAWDGSVDPWSGMEVVTCVERREEERWTPPVHPSEANWGSKNRRRRCTCLKWNHAVGSRSRL